MQKVLRLVLLKCLSLVLLLGSLSVTTLLDVGSVEASSDPRVEMLLKMLEQRDAMILDLQKRVTALERHAGPTPENGPPSAAKKPVPRTAASARDSNSQEHAGPSSASQAKAAPGQFEVDEDAADRALERTLVQEGVLLLPVGQAEIQPSLNYTRNENAAPLVIGTDQQAFVVTDELRRNELTADLQLRFGLPYDSQIEFGVPYRYVDQSRVTSIGFDPVAETDSDGSGFGDLRVGIAKTILREQGWWPDLVGRLVWDSSTGKRRDGEVGLGGGFNELRGTLSMLKRQDPLAFTGALSFGKTFERDDIDPGDEISLSIGTALAASPETSLRFGLEQSFVSDLEVNDRTIDGSDQVVGVLTLGASSIVGRRTLLNFSSSAGLTDDAPDYSFNISLGMRFDIPGIGR